MIHKPHILLVVLTIFVPLAFFTTYAISVLNGDVAPDFPYISDTGTTPPSSCFFGQFLDIGAAISILIIYARYLHVRNTIDELAPSVNARIMHILNKFGFFLGFLFSLGVTIVGNFQETNVIRIHMIGAMMTFFSCLFYVMLQTGVSNHLSLVLHSTWTIFLLRICIILIAISNVFTTSIFANIANKKFNGTDRLHWKDTDGGYFEHVFSTASEWTLGLTLMLGLVSFYKDFRSFHLSEPQIVKRSLSGKDDTEDLFSRTLSTETTV